MYQQSTYDAQSMKGMAWNKWPTKHDCTQPSVDFLLFY